MFIDCDAHVDECSETWSYIPDAKKDLRPAEMGFSEDSIPSFLRGAEWRGTGFARGLLIDGEIYGRRNRNDEKTQTTADTREMRDIALRLKHMDEQGVEHQVLYPSTLLSEVTKRAEVEITLCESYNRWLADRCGESNGRLHWNMMLPLLSTEASLKEMRRAKEAGAIGIFKRGFEAGKRRAGAEYFHPIYELAQELDLPICIHQGGSHFGTAKAFARTRAPILYECYVIDAFVSLIMSGTTKKFPNLRFLMVEASSSWLPFALYQCNFVNVHRTGSVLTSDIKVARSPKEVLAEERIFVTCESNEELAIIIQQVGDDNLVIGTDYGHSDRSAQRFSHRVVTEREDVLATSAEKITNLNGRRAYGFTG